MQAQWLLWLALALAAGVVEILTLSLVFAMVAGGALVAAVVAGVTSSATLSVLAFAASTGLLMAVVRPPLLRYSGRLGPGPATGVAALVGRQAVVTRQVSSAEGEVKLAGEIWTARADRPGAVLETGSLVVVTRIEGATAVVSPSRHEAVEPLESGPGPALPPPGPALSPPGPALPPPGTLPDARPDSPPGGRREPRRDSAALPGGENLSDRAES
ncbi:MAG TPA: NfeD family protein [Kineosporiaceae bacterium]